MRYYVLTALAALCLTCHLPLGAGHTQGQHYSLRSAATENLPLLSLAVDGSNRWNASQPPLQDDGIPEALEEDSAAPLMRDAMIAASQDVAPIVFDQLGFTAAPQKDTVTTPQEISITTLQDDIISTHQEDVFITTQEDIIVTTPHEYVITTTRKDIISTHEASSSITPQEDIAIPLEGIISTTPQEDIAIPLEGIISTTPQEDIITTSPLEDITTLQGDITTTQESYDQKANATVTEPELEDGQVPIRIDQVVICSCPEMTPDGCRRFLSDASIDSKDDEYEDIRRPVADLNVVVHNVTCLKKDHRLMNFSEGQFFHRERGDLVLRNAGYMTGLRVNDYCADLRHDQHGYTKWTIKICVPPPSVPRCCPYGQALKDGVCRGATSPAKLEPPLSAGLDEKPIYWPITNNHYHPLNCTNDPLMSIPLVPQKSYLLSVPAGIMHIWTPPDGHVPRHYTYAPDLCVDGYVDASGSVVYSANICYTLPEEVHRRVCSGHTCVRKCCGDDEEMSLSLYRCVPSNRTAYEFHFTTPPDEYRVVNGWPLCTYRTLIDSAVVDSRGRFHFHDDPLSAREYCVDKFNDGRGKIEDKAMVCVKEPTKAWAKARQIAFPICLIISILFLMLTMCCYCLVPTLLQGGGWYQLFHVLSLMMGYASMFAQKIFSKTWEKKTCFIMGIALQFSFLATFFWLNVLCFDVWRKIRSLNKFRPASVIPIWVYILYAFGVPIAIGVLTVCMQFYAPDGVPGVVKPNLARSRCFFPDPTALFLYFYGPIAILFALNILFITHTYWTYRKIEKNAAVLRKKSPERTNERNIPAEQIHRKRDYISDFKQQFSLLVLMSTCWITEVMSWLIPPLELWAATDLLNTLQGFFIFVIFITHRTKRKHLKKKFPLLFKIAHHLHNAIRQCCCPGSKECLSPFSRVTSQVGRKLSNTSLVSNLSTLSTSLKFSTSSFSVTLPDEPDTKRPSVIEPSSGIIMLSHSSIKNNSPLVRENFDSQC